jgi:hypothetical protein
MTEIAAEAPSLTWTNRIGDGGSQTSEDSGEPRHCPLVLVEWEDTTQPVSSWQWISLRLIVRAAADIRKCCAMTNLNAFG